MLIATCTGTSKRKAKGAKNWFFESQGTTASLFFVPDVFGISIIQGRLQDVNGVPVVGICETPFTGVNEALKRASDIVLASAILLLLAPLMLVLAIGVKLSSPGPVIFRQRRNGLGGEEIVVYKFRTMRVLEDGEVVRQATRDDDRVTPFGRFLRLAALPAAQCRSACARRRVRQARCRSP